MLKKDMTKMTVEEIEGAQKGVLPTKIVYNTIIENSFQLWFICSTDGTKMFFAGLGSDQGGTIAWTQLKLAASYINRDEVLKVLLKSFGSQVVLAKMSLFYLQKMLNPMNANFLSTIIVNPSKSFYVPISLSFFKKLANEDSAEIKEIEFELDLKQSEYVTMQFDKDSQRYEFGENEDYISLISD